MSAMVEPVLHKLSIEAFNSLWRAGHLGEGDRVELIDGLILDMAPIGRPHMSLVNRLTRWLRGRLDEVAAALPDFERGPFAMAPGGAPPACFPFPFDNRSRTSNPPGDACMLVMAPPTGSGAFTPVMSPSPGGTAAPLAKSMPQEPCSANASAEASP